MENVEKCEMSFTINVFFTLQALKTLLKQPEKTLADCGKLFLDRFSVIFLIFKVINMAFQHKLCVEKSNFTVEHKFSIQFSTYLLKTFLNIIFSLCIKRFLFLTLRIF